MHKCPRVITPFNRSGNFRISSICLAFSMFLAILAAPACGRATAPDYLPPQKVAVMPVFFVPQDQAPPSAKQLSDLMRHLHWTQTRYREMLGTTFQLLEKPLIHTSARPLSYYRKLPEKGMAAFAGELLDKFKLTRWNCPYIFVTLIMNPNDDFPVGRGQPFNGGINTGGGLLIVSSQSLYKPPNFQSTLQHELGHTFGLPHPNVYGYDMNNSASLMSYNLHHHTNGFTPGKTPGTFIPEDIRALAKNKRAFPTLEFSPARDVPAGYGIRNYIICLGPLDITGHPGGIQVTTPSGEAFNSRARNAVQGVIYPSRPDIGFKNGCMWHSAQTANGLASITLTFPVSVTLSAIGVHSQHSGRSHEAKAVRISPLVGGKLRTVAQTRLVSVDQKVAFPPTPARVWKLDFQAGPSNYVVIRGLQFYSGKNEVFLPLAVY